MKLLIQLRALAATMALLAATLFFVSATFSLIPLRGITLSDPDEIGGVERVAL